MRAIVQRVKSAYVEVDGETISSIGPGLLCLIGLKDGDSERDSEYISKKILKCKAFSNVETGAAWKEDVTSRGYEVLLVSQFTLYGRLRKKNAPDFSKAMPPQQARDTYQAFVERIRREYGAPERVRDGVFGAMMQVGLVNDGPVTFILDSESQE